jgi:hypothetical protein
MRFSSYISFYKNPKPAKTKILIFDSHIQKNISGSISTEAQPVWFLCILFLVSRMNLILNFIDVFFCLYMYMSYTYTVLTLRLGQTLKALDRAAAGAAERPI